MKCLVRLAPLALVALAACSPKFDITDENGVHMFEVQRGGCFVGCNVTFTREDGTKCSGFSPMLAESHAFAADIYCPGEPMQVITTQQPLDRNTPTIGKLELKSAVEARSRANLTAYIDSLN